MGDGATQGVMATNGTATAKDGIVPTVVSAKSISSKIIQLTMDEPIAIINSTGPEFVLDGIALGGGIEAVNGSTTMNLVMKNSFAYVNKVMTISFNPVGWITDNTDSWNPMRGDSTSVAHSSSTRGS